MEPPKRKSARRRQGGESMESEMISIKEVSKRIGRGTAFVEKALREKQFPVGIAIYNDQTDRWTYIIPRAEFENWIGGQIPTINMREIMDKLGQLLDQARTHPIW